MYFFIFFSNFLVLFSNFFYFFFIKKHPKKYCILNQKIYTSKPLFPIGLKSFSWNKKTPIFLLFFILIFFAKFCLFLYYKFSIFSNFYFFNNSPLVFLPLFDLFSQTLDINTFSLFSYKFYIQFII